ESLEFGEPVLSAVSTVTGEPVGPGLWSDPSYWVGQVRQTVRFGDAVVALEGLGVTGLLELGPDAALTGVAREVLGSGVTAVAAQRRDRDEVESWLTALARLHVTGTPVEWFTGGHRHVDLPTYPFDHQNYWPEIQPTWTGDRLRYGVTWAPLDPPVPGVPAGRWLLVRPYPGGIDAATLAALGLDVVEVQGGTDRAVLADRVRVAAGTGPIDGVIFAADGDDAATPARHGVSVLAALVQALGDAGIAAPLWCVTSGAVGIGEADPAVRPEAAMLWGYGRAAALENPAAWGGLVDVPPGDDARSIPQLLALLATPTDEDQIAVREDGCHGRRLARAPIADETAVWEPRDTVLITGGTGALGGEVARWAAANGAAHLVLASRRGADAPGVADLVGDLEAAGARTTVVACDLTDPDAVPRLLAAVPEEHPLSAVVHAAGAPQAQAIADTGADELAAVLSAKVDGAERLDQALAGTPLDAFILFSSIAAAWGSGGQAGYAAASAYLDALATRRRARGEVATSIAWGPWAGGGMAAGEDARDHLSRRGLTGLATADALDALSRAVGNDETAVVVADVNWDRFAATFTASRPSPLLTGLVSDAAPAADSTTDRAEELRVRLSGMGARDREAELTTLVRAEVAAVLGHADPSTVDPRRPFTELGFDSLTAVELRDALRSRTGLELPATLVFNHPNVAALAGYLGGELAISGTDPRADLSRLEASLAAAPPDPAVQAEVAARLKAILDRWAEPSDELSFDSDDELLAFIDADLGGR
ncbi:type I polyketide synthase, partial [Rugosimonospora acidiphila]|uniref:type I polyketide synthase n=1 Tax=Rugosimonospora acidiphila TaxID=556531 RepID=UPI0031E8D6FE